MHIRTYIPTNTYIHTYIHTYINTYTQYIPTYIYIQSYIYTHNTDTKMADDVIDGMENSLNITVSTAERSGNMKKIEVNYIRNCKYTQEFILKLDCRDGR